MKLNFKFFFLIIVLFASDGKIFKDLKAQEVGTERKIVFKRDVDVKIRKFVMRIGGLRAPEFKNVVWFQDGQTYFTHRKVDVDYPRCFIALSPKHELEVNNRFATIPADTTLLWKDGTITISMKRSGSFYFSSYEHSAIRVHYHHHFVAAIECRYPPDEFKSIETSPAFKYAYDRLAKDLSEATGGAVELTEN
ncbi:MAG: hypothetical protein OXB84_04545 [Halobacteriovoraceae bacterium]|nr:hypothetical protein [Halobacteriovoraceae bacterium]